MRGFVKFVKKQKLFIIFSVLHLVQKGQILLKFLLSLNKLEHIWYNIKVFSTITLSCKAKISFSEHFSFFTQLIGRFF